MKKKRFINWFIIVALVFALANLILLPVVPEQVRFTDENGVEWVGFYSEHPYRAMYRIISSIGAAFLILLSELLRYFKLIPHRFTTIVWIPVNKSVKQDIHHYNNSEKNITDAYTLIVNIYKHSKGYDDNIVLGTDVDKKLFIKHNLSMDPNVAIYNDTDHWEKVDANDFYIENMREYLITICPKFDKVNSLSKPEEVKALADAFSSKTV
jgi:hypothetical protein